MKDKELAELAELAKWKMAEAMLSWGMMFIEDDSYYMVEQEVAEMMGWA